MMLVVPTMAEVYNSPGISGKPKPLKYQPKRLETTFRTPTMIGTTAVSIPCITLTSRANGISQTHSPSPRILILGHCKIKNNPALSNFSFPKHIWTIDNYLPISKVEFFVVLRPYFFCHYSISYHTPRSSLLVHSQQ